tara:strand:+ start:62 stop:631 length:570 start_codon:yes stop_codon:yes gene_type:complete
MNNLSNDLLRTFVSYISWNETLRYRILSKRFKNVVHEWFWDEEVEDTYPSSCMVSVRVCDVCNKKYDFNINQKMCTWYNLPRPVYIFCSNKKCIHTIYRNFFQECKNRNIEIVIKRFLQLDKNREIRIPRSNDKITYGSPNQNYLLNKNGKQLMYVWWCEEEETYSKNIDISHEIVKKSVINNPITVNL